MSIQTTGLFMLGRPDHAYLPIAGVAASAGQCRARRGERSDEVRGSLWIVNVAPAFGNLASAAGA